jgi:hypothetical protein
MLAVVSGNAELRRFAALFGGGIPQTKENYPNKT